ncbi:MAG: hypothetical protein C3F02_01095 [Parcubacteria group bacterium]|nr:MAG: hypothetical protein C3F02_01095 [Parcubacteria group bacterium]
MNTKYFQKKYVVIFVIIVVVVFSQVALVQLVYAHKISGAWANSIARVYRLKAGTIVKGQDRLYIYMSDYLENKNLAVKFISAGYAKAQSSGDTTYTMPTDEQISQMVWDKLLKDAWLGKLSRDNNIKITPEDMTAYLADVVDEESLKKEAQDDYDLSYDDYKKLVIKPFILEAKVYDYLLGTFQDSAGAKKAQEAYSALEGGQKFADVAKQYSEDQASAEKSVWLAESDLVNFYEPIKKLTPGKFSEIVIAPGAYIIWYLESLVTEKDKPATYEVKGIFIKAKAVEEFLQDYLEGAQVTRIYQS